MHAGIFTQPLLTRVGVILAKSQHTLGTENYLIFDIIEMYIDRKLDIIDIIVFFICVFNLLKSISGLVLTELRPKDILGQGSLCDFCTLVLPQVVDIDLGRYGSFAHSISKIALFLRLPRRLTLQMFWLVRGDVLLL